MKLFSNNSLANRNGTPENEYELLSKLDYHPNVVKVYDFIRSKEQVQIPRNIPRDENDTFAKFREGNIEHDNASYITMELCKKDLFDLVAEVGPLKDDSLIRYIFSELCSGVDALHTET